MDSGFLLLAGAIALSIGLTGGWLVGRFTGRKSRKIEIDLHRTVSEFRALGELSAFKAVSKDLITHVDHSFGDFGKKYLSWAFTKKKLAMLFEFEMDFRFDLRSEEVKIEAQGAHAIVHLPQAKVDVAIKNLSFYDEQRARFLPWLLPDLLQGFFDGRFSEEDKNRLISAARDHAVIEAKALALRYRPQIEASAHSTLQILTRSLGYQSLEVRFGKAEPLINRPEISAPESVQALAQQNSPNQLDPEWAKESLKPRDKI
jgi:Protein of unknown function (DUF4230)